MSEAKTLNKNEETKVSEPRKLKNFINGEWVESKTTKYEDIINPATKEVVAQVPLSTKEELDYAAEVAAKAFESWKRVPVPKRARILFNFQQLLQKNKDELARLITIENGKNTTEALGEVGRGIENVEFAAGAPTLMMGDSLSTIASDVEATNYRYPIGVVGGITPFNFPFNMATRTIFPAIALGNSVVHKPDLQVGIIGGQVFAKAFEEAGLPAGVFNSILTDLQESGDEFLINQNSSFISFTGSTDVGRHIGKVTGGSLKQMALELGGNNPLVVLSDADIEQAVKIAVFGKFLHSGQICAITNRIIVHRDIYDEFISHLGAEKAKLYYDATTDEMAFFQKLVQEQKIASTL
jgi:acyl-CoA reductase-like NAD-dependent aldehyde dehydrogenase